MAEVEENDNGVSMALKENGAAMESKEEGLFGRKLVDCLRSQLNLPYDDCVGAALIVMEELVEYMQNHNHSRLEIATVKRLQNHTSFSQEDMSRSQARDSWDFKNAVMQINGLENYRKGAGNREKCWPGGTFPTNAKEEDGPSELCPASAVSELQNAFKRANPRVLYHVVEYPGENSPDEFKLIELVADEFQWFLQTSESPPAGMTSGLLQDLCGILQSSIEIHSQALKVAARNSTIRSVIFRILRKTIRTRQIDSSTNSSQVLINFIKIATAILSVLHNDAELSRELDSGVSMDEIFFELTTCIRELVSLASNPLTVGKLKEHLVALLTAVCGFSRNGDNCSVVKYHGFFFCDLWNAVTTPGKDEFAQYVGQTVLEWWNYHGVRTSGAGMDLESQFGLKNACAAVSWLLAELVSVRLGPSNGQSPLAYFPRSLSVDDASTDDFFLIGNGDCEVVVGMCRRMCEDSDPEDQVQYKIT